MQNPWINFTYDEPYILRNELEEIRKFNRTHGNKTCIHTDLLPEPYFGNINAPIVLLNLNPGVSNEEDRYRGITPYFMETHQKNLLHEDQDYPFYLLDPQNTSPWQDWWMNKFRFLLRDGIEIRTLANEIFCLEFFPYHSKHYGYNGPILNSQAYNFYLLQNAIKQNALIIVLRSEKIWKKYFPVLIRNNEINYYKLRSPQNVVLSPNNLNETYNMLLQILRDRQNN